MKNFNFSLRIKLLSLFIAVALCLPAVNAVAQDIDPVTDTLQLVPAGSYVIAMDDTLQKDATTGLFNVKAYGLLATLLDNQIELFWAIRAGKTQTDTDFTATATRVIPTTQAAATRRFRTGPFIVEPVDSVNFLAVVNTFNAANTGHTINVYQMTTSAKVDIRYILRQKPRAAVLNDGGNASIQINYMTLASMPTANYTMLSSASHLSDSCYTFASEPHNGSPVSSVIDSIHAFVTKAGGNFLAQCLAITQYENATNGRFQSTLGITANSPNNETTAYLHPDLSYSQFEDPLDPNLINSAVPSWSLVTGSVFTNSTQEVDRYSNRSDTNIMCLTVSKNGTGPGHLVFYAGGHDYGDATTSNTVQGMRAYFDAMFTPSNVQACAFLIFNNDLSVTKTVYHNTIAINQQDTFKIVLTNNGPSSAVADTVTATDILPAGLSFVSAVASKGTYNSGTGLWSVGNVNYLETDSLIIIATATTSGSITNTTYIHKEKFDFNQANDTSRVTITVAGCASAHAGNDTAICTGNSAILGGSPTGTGGTSPYTYNWSPSTALSAANIANPTATPTATTSYFLTVTDALGCAGKDTVKVTVNPVPSVIASSSKTSYCSGDTIKLSSLPSGGTSPYTYNWAGPSSFASTVQNPVRPLATTVMSGTYSITLTDHNGCSATASTAAITVNPQPAVSASSSSTTYCSGSTIQLTSSPNGGTPGYNYAWSFSGGGFTPGNLQNPTRPTSTTAMSGTYTVTVTDVNGCTATASAPAITVYQSPAVAAAVTTPTTTCSGDSIHLTSTPSLGTSPYTYSWSGPSGFSSNIQNPGRLNVTTAASGIYNVTVTDAHSCSASASTSNVTVNQSPAITAGSSSAAYCSGATINLLSTPTSGTPTYSYSWSFSGGGFSPGNVQNPTRPNSTTSMSGVYSVTVTDVNSCSASASTSAITVNPSPVVTAGSNTPVCSGGTINLTSSTSTGTSPFGYSWSGPSFTNGNQNPSITGASSANQGTYTVTISDAHGCSGTGSTNVTVNATTTVNVTSNSPVCTGATISLNASLTGGTGPFSYTWSGQAGFNPGNVSSPTRTNAQLSYQGSYSVTVSDANNCSGTGSTFVTINQSPSLTASSNSIVCYGDTLKLNSIPSGGTAGYNYTWSGPASYSSSNQNPVRASATPAMNGSYNVTVSDANLCTASATTSVTVNPSISATAGTASTICNGQTDTLGGNPTAAGGTTPYGYSWSGGASAVANPVVSPSGTTTYNLTVTDKNNCKATASVTINVNPTPTASAGPNVTLPSCSPTGIQIGGNTTASGGGGAPYTYNWTPITGLSNAVIANPVVQGILNTATYQVVVTDKNGCSASSQTTVNVINDTPSASIAAGSSTSWCAGSGGSVLLSANTTGGTGTLAYAWSGSNLSAFNVQQVTANPSVANTYTYTVTVTDAFNCTATATSAVTVNSNPSASAQLTGGFTICANSSVIIGGNPTAAGGSGSYTYSWSSGASPVANPTVGPLTTTSYVVTVTDSKSCTATASTLVTVNANPSANAGPTQSEPGCSLVGVNIGGTPSASGGTGPYTYTWSPTGGLSSSTTSNPNVTGIGSTTTYSLLVADFNGCTATSSVVVNVTSSSLSVTILDNPSLTWCAGTGSQVTLTAIPANGSSPYTEQWTGTNLSATTGLVTVANPNIAGTYTYSVNVTDATGCNAGNSVTVTVYPAVTASAGPSSTDTICNGQSIVIGGSPTANGGTSPYTYTWNNGAASIANPTVSPTSLTSYNVIVTDSNNCTASATTAVAVRSNPIANAGPNVSVTSCSPTGVQIGGAPTAQNGNGGPYTYSWSPTTYLTSANAPNPNVVGLPATAGYTVTVTDVKGCTASNSVQVTLVNNTPSVSISGAPLRWCAGSVSGVNLTANTAGGTSPLSYNWSGTNLNPSNTQVVAAGPVATGSYYYNVTVTDGFNCTTTATQTILIDSVPVASAGNGGFATCMGTGIQIGGSPTAKGGTTPYTYAWNGGASAVANPTVNPAGTTTYTVTVTDANTCSSTSSTTVTVHPLPVASAGPAVTQPLCSPTGIQIGGTPTATAGTGPFTYSWSPATALSSATSANPTVQGLNTTTTYTVVVTDFYLCTASAQVIVTVSTTPPAVNISSSVTPEWCASSSNTSNLTANISGGNSPFSFSWSGSNINPTNAQTVAVNPQVAGSYLYNVTVTDNFNCTASATETVIVDSLPRANAGSNQTICNSSSITIGGSPTAAGGTLPYSYSWSSGASAVANPAVSPSATTTYFITVSDHHSCTATASTTVTVRPLPIANAGLNKTLPACSPTGIQIGGTPTASGGGGAPYVYAWGPSTGLQPDSFVANPTVVGISSNTTYTVIVSDANNCTASSQVLVTVTNTPPIVNISSSGPAQWCAGSNTAINLTANVTGGVAAFGYQWSGGTNPVNTSVVSVNPNVAGVYPYHVTVTDGFNCTATASISVSVDTLPVATAGPVNGFNVCYGHSVNLGGTPTVTGGIPPYTYLWSGGAAAVANPSVTPLTTTTYLLTVTDSKGCSATAAATVNVNDPLVANAGVQQHSISCSGSCVLLGSSPTASGGTGVYTYKWSPGIHLNDSIIANPTACGLPGNTFFSVTVTDQLGCSASSQVLITVSPGTLAANVEPGGYICAGTNDSVMLGGFPTAVGGTPPYTYTWSPTTSLNLHDPANPIAFPSVTTEYDLTLTDALGCSVTDSAVVVIRPKVIVNAGDDTTVCAGFPVNLGGSPTATGGSGSYTYQWSPTTGLTTVTGANPQALLNATTTYIVTATDANGCSATGNVIININPTPVANAGVNKTMTFCPLDSVILGGSPAATGGTAPYTYNWTPAAGLDSLNVPHPVVKGIDSSENYVLFVTDTKGCVATSFVTVTVKQTTLQAQAGNNSSLCANTATPATLGGSPTATGGTSPYIYRWSPGAGLSSSTVPNPTAHPAATTVYYLTVTDALGCSSIDSATVAINPAPVANAGRDTFLCSGNEVTIGGSPTASSGTPGYTYSWSPANGFISPTNSSNPLLAPLVSTTYQVIVTDSKGCSASDLVLVTVRPNPVVSAGSDMNITTCPDDSVQIGGFPPASGGTSPYSYLWSPNNGLYYSNLANPWVKGISSSQSYQLQVTDANGCKGSDFVEVIVVQSTLQANAGNDQAICGAPGATAQLGGAPTAVGGSSPYTYHWFPSAGLNSSSISNPTAQPLASTVYYVTVTDSKGCTSVDSVVITVKPVPGANAGDDTSICNGFGVTLGGAPTASGGTPGYTYSWSPTLGLNSNNSSNPVAVPSSTSTYALTVTDASGCKAITAVTIIVNPNPVANAGANVSVSTCSGDSTRLGGSPSASGGTPSYSYVWSPGLGLTCTNCANPWVKGNANSGFYSLTVTDVNGCTATGQTLVTVKQNNLSANTGNGGSLCPGAATGITLGGSPTAQGGTATYTYAWSPSNGLSSATVANPVANPSATTKYYLTITDAKGCQAVDSVQVAVYPAMTVNAGADTTICNGIKVQLGGNPTVSGGVSPFTYSWSPTVGLSSPVASNPFATPGLTHTYTVTVTGKTGCTASASVNVKVNPRPTANAGTNGTLVACNADSLKLGGSPAASGGTTPYTYTWSPAGGLNCNNCANPYASHLGSNATYTLVVTDSNGCSAQSQVSITVTGSGLRATAGNGATFCQGSVTPVTLGGNPTASGGNGTYTYVWSPSVGLSSSTVANPTATPTVTTKYNLAVTDGNGCVGIDSVLITINPKPMANAGANDTICAGSQVLLGGSPTASGGTGSAYTYIWSPTSNFITSNTIANPKVQPSSSLIYSVVVTDSIGCTASSSVSITVHQNPTANAGANQTVVACALACVNLGGNTTASGGTAPYFYAWAPSAGLNNTGLANPSACNLTVTGIYHVTVTDKNGCTATSQATITVNQSNLTAEAGGDKNFCAGATTGVVLGGTPTASGGTSPYSYSWNPTTGITSLSNIANPTANPADTTTYIVIVQDALGCTAKDSSTVFVDPAITAHASNDTAICAGSSAQLGGSPIANGGTTPYTYSWNPGTGLSSVMAANPVATPLTTTTYCVTVTDHAGCTASICETVNINPAVTACAGPANGLTMTSCSGSFVQLGCSPTASGGSGNFSYSWSPAVVNVVRVLNGSTISNPIVTGLTTSTVFTVTVTDNGTGCSATAQVNVTVNQSTLAAQAGNNQVLCSGAGSCITIGGNPTATGGVSPYQYQWSATTGINNPVSANPCVLPVTTTTYDVTVTDHLGCSATDSVTVKVNPQIVVNAGADTAICHGQSVMLGNYSPEVIGGASPYTYAWSPTQNLNITTSANPTAQNLTSNVTYTLLVTDSLHCTASGSISINVRPLPTANAGPNATIYACAGDSALLGGTPTGTGTVAPYTYLWNPPLTISLSCISCANPYVSNLGSNTQFCVTVTDSFGCQAQSCTNVTVLPNTVLANATPTPLPTLCSNAGSCVTLGATPPVTGGVGPYTYNWVQINSTQGHPVVCPTSTTTYTLIGTDSKGCQATDSVQVVVNISPVASIAGLNSQYCVNSDHVIMQGTPAGGTFSGPGVTGNIFQPGVVGAGNWCIKYTYTDPSTGCSDDTIICVTVNPLPVVSITGNVGVGSSYCQSAPPIPLTGSPAGGKFTGTGMVGNVFYPDSAIIGNNNIAYTYTDSVTGCSNSASTVITVKANPVLSLSASTDTACSGQLVTLTPTYSFDVFNIVWSTLSGANLASGVGPVSVHPTGTDYCVVAAAVNTPNGCITRDTICIDVYQPPTLSAPVIANTCENLPAVVDVAANVVDPQNHADVITVVVQPLHGGLTTTANGIYTYTPVAFFNGQDSFKFTVCNSACSNTCDTGFALINICAVPTPPVILDTTLTINENDSVNVCPVIFDHNGLSLTIGNAACDSLYGQLIFTSDSCFKYIPANNYVGTQTLCITVCNTAGLCDTGSVVIHVIQVGVKPVAVIDYDTTNYLTTITVPVISNDYNTYGDSIHVTGILCPANEGTAILNANGTVTYHPDSSANACHPDTFCYQLCDVAFPNLCDTAKVIIYIRPSVFAVNDNATTSQHSPVTIPVLQNDFTPDCTPIGVNQVITTATTGTVVINANGTVTYTPKSDTCGFVDSFRYIDTTALGAHDTATVFVNILCCPVKLVAVTDSETIQPNTTLTFNPAANDTTGGASLTYTILSGPFNGNAHFANDTQLVYIPTLDYCGPDHMQYLATGPCGSDTGNIIIKVICRTTPFAANDTLSSCSTLPVSINVFLKDTAETGFTLTVSSEGNPIPANLGSITSVSNGIITYTPVGLAGTVSFLYTVCDNGTQQRCSSGTIVINLSNCQTPVVTTIYDTTLINTTGISCVGGHVFAAGNTWFIDSLCNAQFGIDSVIGPGDTCITYIPNNGYTGNDTFCIVVCDTFGCTTSEVIYTVLDTAIKANPIYCDQDTTPMNSPDTLYVLAHDTIPKAGDTTLLITKQPLNGQATVNSNNSVIYIPMNNYKGTDELVYEVCAVTGTYKFCDTASVCISIIDTAHHCVIPDGFSPNGDNVNDVYEILCDDMYPQATLKIFNRWGDQVWDSNGPYQNNWNGKNQDGTICPSGTYFIIYDYHDGVHKSVAKFLVINR